MGDKIKEFIRAHRAAMAVPRKPRPAHIPIGASWTTKESSDAWDEVERIRELMTVDEQRSAYILMDWMNRLDKEQA